MTTLAVDGFPAVAESWPAVVVYAIITIGGWVSLYLKQRGDGNKQCEQTEKVDEKVTEIRDHVANGHVTNLRDDLTEGLRLMGIVKDHVERLHDDHIVGIHNQLGDIGRDLGRIRDEIGEERQERRREIGEERDARERLEGIVRSHHPEPPEGQ